MSGMTVTSLANVLIPNIYELLWVDKVLPRVRSIVVYENIDS